MAEFREIPTAAGAQIPQGVTSSSSGSAPRRQLLDTTPLVRALQGLKEEQVQEIKQQALVHAEERGRQEELLRQSMGDEAPPFQIDAPVAAVRNRGFIYEQAANIGRAKGYATQIASQHAALIQEKVNMLPNAAITNGWENKRGFSAEFGSEQGRLNDPDGFAHDSKFAIEEALRVANEMDPTGVTAQELTPRLQQLWQTGYMQTAEGYELEQRAKFNDAASNEYLTTKAEFVDRLRLQFAVPDPKTGMMSVDGLKQLLTDFNREGGIWEQFEKQAIAESTTYQLWRPSQWKQDARAEHDRVLDDLYAGLIGQAVKTGDYNALKLLDEQLTAGTPYWDNRDNIAALRAMIGSGSETIADDLKDRMSWAFRSNPIDGTTTVDRVGHTDIRNTYKHEISMVVPGWETRKDTVMSLRENELVRSGKALEYFYEGRVLAFGAEGGALDLTKFGINPAYNYVLAARPGDASALFKQPIDVNKLIANKEGFAAQPADVQAELLKLQGQFVHPFGDEGVNHDIRTYLDGLVEMGKTLNTDPGRAARLFDAIPVDPLNPGATDVKSVMSQVGTKYTTSGALATTIEKLAVGDTTASGKVLNGLEMGDERYNLSGHPDDWKEIGAAWELALASPNNETAIPGMNNQALAETMLDSYLRGILTGRQSTFSSEKGELDQYAIDRLVDDPAMDGALWATVGRALGPDKQYIADQMRTFVSLKNTSGADNARLVQFYRRQYIPDETSTVYIKSVKKTDETIITTARALSSGDQVAADALAEDLAKAAYARSLETGADFSLAAKELYGNFQANTHAMSVSGRSIVVRAPFPISNDMKNALDVSANFVAQAMADQVGNPSALVHHIANSTPFIERDGADYSVYFAYQGKPLGPSGKVFKIKLSAMNRDLQNNKTDLKKYFVFE